MKFRCFFTVFSSLKFRPLIIQVTAFTLAHSITLALAAAGLVQVQSYIVEPIIALSIVWVAVENTVFKKTTKWRPLVVFSFGLLHGLGFAALLTQYGLPKDNFISLLMAFYHFYYICQTIYWLIFRYISS